MNKFYRIIILALGLCGSVYSMDLAESDQSKESVSALVFEKCSTCQ